MHRELYQAWGQLQEHQWEFHVAWLALAGGLYAVGMVPAGVFWYLLLRGLGQDARLGPSLRAYCIGHLGKYVPGKALVVVMRAGMVCGERVSAAVAAVAVVVETLTMMAAGSFLSGAILAIWFRHRDLPWYIYGGAIGMVVVSGLPTLPPVFRLVMRLTGVGKSDPETAQKLQSLSYSTLLTGWILMPLMWVCWALSYWATLRGMGATGMDPLAELPFFTATVALAVVAGFAVLITPGGLGPRELVLVMLVKPHLENFVPNAALMAAASVVVLRLVWLVAELVVSGILYPMSRARTDRGAP